MNDKYVKDFYLSNGGQRLVNPNNYPPKIEDFLSQEKLLVSQLLIGSSIDLLLEVGCMQGRNKDIAKDVGINYLGIDIAIADEQEFICSDGFRIEQIRKISITDLNSSHLELAEGRQPLAFFPFNSFGNLSDSIGAIRNLSKLKVQILISTYKTDSETSFVREQYYRNCGYKNIQPKHSEKGTTFVSDDGLRTIAYNEKFILDLLRTYGYCVGKFDIGQIGIGYTGLLTTSI